MKIFWVAAHFGVHRTAPPCAPGHHPHHSTASAPEKEGAYA